MTTRIETIDFRPLDLDGDLERLHAWVTHPGSLYWQMQDADLESTRAEYASLEADPHHHVLIGEVDGLASFLMEHYDPAHSDLAGVYDARPGDVGMHVLVAPTDTPRSGFTDRVFAAVMARLFADPATGRVVVEPDVRNTAIRAKNAAAGFVVDRIVDLPTKTAALSLCTRAAFSASRLGGDLP